MSTFSDFNTSLAVHPVKKDLSLKTDENAVKQSVKNILLTNTLEKPFSPLFGANLNSFLFELSEFFDEQEIEDEVRTAIENYEPRAIVRNVKAVIIPDNNDIKVTVGFQVVNTLESVTLEVSLGRLR